MYRILKLRLRSSKSSGRSTAAGHVGQNSSVHVARSIAAIWPLIFIKDTDEFQYRLQPSPILCSIGIWPARNPRLNNTSWHESLYSWTHSGKISYSDLLYFVYRLSCLQMKRYFTYKYQCLPYFLGHYLEYSGLFQKIRHLFLCIFSFHCHFHCLRWSHRYYLKIVSKKFPRFNVHCESVNWLNDI